MKFSSTQKFLSEITSSAPNLIFQDFSTHTQIVHIHLLKITQIHWTTLCVLLCVFLFLNICWKSFRVSTNRVLYYLKLLNHLIATFIWPSPYTYICKFFLNILYYKIYYSDTVNILIALCITFGYNLWMKSWVKE